MNILIIIFIVFAIYKKVIKDGGIRENKPNIPPQRSAPAGGNKIPYIPPNQKVMNSIKKAPVKQAPVKQAYSSEKYYSDTKKTQPITVVKESVMQKYEDMAVLRKVVEDKDRKVQSNFAVQNDLLGDIAFPEVLYAGLNYMNVPDTLPNFDIEDIMKIEIGAGSEME